MCSVAGLGPWDLVGGDGHAEAGAADEQGAVVLTPGDSLGDLGGDVEVAAVAVVVDLEAPLAEVGGQALLQGGADGDRCRRPAPQGERLGTKVWSVMGGRT